MDVCPIYLTELGIFPEMLIYNIDILNLLILFKIVNDTLITIMMNDIKLALLNS